jgi:DNA-binding response OmpR family regulator
MPRILVVDDEVLIAEMLGDWLIDLGYEVAGPAYSVDRALAVIAQGDPLDGAILDVTLGGGDSYPIAEELRRRRVQFVFVTGHDALAPQFHGATTLTKPFDFDALKATLAKCCAPSVRPGTPAATPTQPANLTLRVNSAR